MLDFTGTALKATKRIVVDQYISKLVMIIIAGMKREESIWHIHRQMAFKTQARTMYGEYIIREKARLLGKHNDKLQKTQIIQNGRHNGCGTANLQN